MKLAILSNADGVIIAAAVCQAFIDGDMSTPVEVALVGRSLGQQIGSRTSTAICRGTSSHIVDAPSFMQEMCQEELHQGLERVYKTMSLQLVEGEPSLREISC